MRRRAWRLFCYAEFEEDKKEMDINIVGAKEVKAQLDKLEDRCNKAIRSTLSDFKKRGPGWISKEVKAKYNIKGNISKTSSIGKVRTLYVGESIEIKYSGHTLTPIYFGITPKSPQRKPMKKTYKIPGAGINTASDVVTMQRIKKSNVYVTIKDRKKQLLQGKYNTPVFFIKSKTGKNLPFQRKGSNPKPIVAIRTVSLPQMVGNEEVKVQIQSTIERELGKRVEHNLMRYWE